MSDQGSTATATAQGTDAGPGRAGEAEHRPEGELDLERVGARVEQLLDEVAAADPVAAQAAEHLVGELLGLYGAGLERVLSIVDESAPSALPRLARDPMVAGLLALHDLHPVDVHARVERALDEVRPYLGSHGGDVELVGVEDDVVRLRLTGSCNGCGASATTLETAVEGAVREAAPEIERLDVEGAVNPSAGDEGLIPLSALTIRRGDEQPAAGWTDLATADIPRHALRAREIGGHRLLLGRIGDAVYAYRDGCPACARSLDDAGIEGVAASCPGCGARFDVPTAGRRLDEAGPGLEPVPLVEETPDHARVALGGGP